MGIKLLLVLTMGSLVGGQTGWSQSVLKIPDSRRIPDEYESVGGHGLGFGNTGAAVLSGASAVRVNPAMLAVEKRYEVHAGYHWPTYGREFYQAGVVDSKTSGVAAGLNYTSSQKKPEEIWQQGEDPFDTPVRQRVGVGLATLVGKAALGISGQYVTYTEEEEARFTEKKGLVLGLGVAGLLTPNLRFGVSGENLTNQKLDKVAPKTYRAGLAYLFTHGDATVHLDYVQRVRVEGFEKNPDPLFYGLTPLDAATEGGDEQMVFGSFSLRIYDLLRLIGAYGQSLGEGDERRSLAGGLAIVQQKFSLSYNLARPYLAKKETHSNVNLSFSLAI